MKSRFVAAGVLAILLLAVTIVAHHSNAAQFDSTKRVTMKGEVTKVEWTNPHAFIYVNVTDAAGKLQRAGLIRYNRGRIAVSDRPGLEARACECYAVVRKEFDRLLPRVH